MSAWNQILSAALVGTDRRPCVLPGEADPVLGGVLPAGPTDAAGLLHAAGSVALAVRASAGVPGTTHPDGADVVTTASGDAPSAERDERAAVPHAASRRLASVLSGPQSDDNQRLAVAWLRLAEETGRRVPHDQLPALLDLGVRRRDAREPVLALGGPRARWLAAHDLDRWTWVARASGDGPGTPSSDLVDVSDRSVWDDGDVHAKVAYLTALRAQDPAAGRDLLLESWGGLRATDLAMLAPVVRDTLEPADEEWLERALDAGVRARAAAAGLLLGLPGSGLVRRMRDRVRSWVSDVDGVLQVTLPQDLDAALRRDGIELKPPVSTKQGRRAWWFEQVVAAAPLDAWTGLTHDPVELLDREIVPDLGAELCRGLARAAARNGDFVLAARLGTDPRAGNGFLLELARTLDAEAAAIVAVTLLRSEHDDMARIDLVLDAVAAPWPHDVSDAVLDYLTPPYGKGKRWVNNVAAAARTGLPLSRLDRVREIAAADSSHRYAGELAEHLETLAAMRAELHATTATPASTS
ncbi:DUF5691 domain-containing protein [Myceligenerans xiligouense]|uniref:Uncharacterized protein n=1 Tax=Myceligenerans xiligouense TaxID=253184 RepID=A0A3N4ZIL6_9MICO|nr:DUF5691 domain-containing protein [Myceligenerans xiligouense]RPF20725.1 hypothetical protein EDD34_1329 [Myceligenerans xiligouense]